MNEKGFTIVELLVVIAVIVILVTVVLVNFQKTKFQLSLSRAAYRVAQDIALSQNLAVTKVPYKDSQGVEQKVDGYGVDFDLTALGNKKYIIYADKNPGNKMYDTNDYTVETVDLNNIEPGIVIKEIDNVASSKVSVDFNSADLMTTITQLNSGQQSVNIVLAVESDFTQTKVVTVTTSGIIEAK